MKVMTSVVSAGCFCVIEAPLWECVCVSVVLVGMRTVSEVSRFPARG